MMFSMAGLLFLNLGLQVQSLARYCYITVDPETRATRAYVNK
jgi:hypothetical protein